MNIKKEFGKYLKFVGTVFFSLGIISLYLLNSRFFPLLEEANVGYNFQLIYFYIVALLVFSAILFIMGMKYKYSKENFTFIAISGTILSIICLWLYKLSFPDVLSHIYLLTKTPL